MPDLQDPWAAHERIANPKRNVVIAAIINDEGNVLLVKTRRFPNHWQPIGGGMETDDASREHALLREIREEAGLSLNEEESRFEITVPYDFGEGEVHCYSVTLPLNQQLSFDDAEILTWRWFTSAEACELDTFPATKAFLDRLGNTPGTAGSN